MASSGSDPLGFLKTSRSGSSAANLASTGHRGGAASRLAVAMAAAAAAAGSPVELPETGFLPRRSQSLTTALTGPSHQPISADSLGAGPLFFSALALAPASGGRGDGTEGGLGGVFKGAKLDILSV